VAEGGAPDGARNEVSASTANVVQAGVIHGDIHFHQTPAPARQGAVVCAVGGDRTWAEWIRALLNEIGYRAQR
jgi:hypothetical protein